MGLEFRSDDKESPPPGWNGWPGPTAAAAILGCKRRDLQAYVADGELKEFKAPDKTVRYDPASVNALKDSLIAAIANERQTEVSADVAKIAAELVKQAQGHVDRCIELMLSHYERAMKVVIDTNGALLERAERAESVFLQAIVARESALDASQERKLELDAQQATQARRDEILAVIKPGVPLFMKSVTDALLVWAGGDAALAKRLLDSFDRERLEVLLETEFLTAEQKELIRDLLKRRTDGQQKGNQEGGKEDAQEGGQEGNQEGGQEARC